MIDRVEVKEQLCRIYGYCSISKKPLNRCSSIEMHHLFSQHIIKTRSSKLFNKIANNKDIALKLRHSFLNFLPLDGVVHRDGVCQYQFTDREFYNIIDYCVDNTDKLDILDFNSNSDTHLIETALMVFEDLSMCPVWFERFF